MTDIRPKIQRLIDGITVLGVFTQEVEHRPMKFVQTQYQRTDGKCLFSMTPMTVEEYERREISPDRMFCSWFPDDITEPELNEVAAQVSNKLQRFLAIKAAGQL